MNIFKKCETKAMKGGDYGCFVYCADDFLKEVIDNFNYQDNLLRVSFAYRGNEVDIVRSGSASKQAVSASLDYREVLGTDFLKDYDSGLFDDDVNNLFLKRKIKANSKNLEYVMRLCGYDEARSRGFFPDRGNQSLLVAELPGDLAKPTEQLNGFKFSALPAKSLSKLRDIGTAVLEDAVLNFGFEQATHLSTNDLYNVCLKPKLLSYEEAQAFFEKAMSLGNTSLSYRRDRSFYDSLLTIKDNKAELVVQCDNRFYTDGLSKCLTRILPKMSREELENLDVKVSKIVDTKWWSDTKYAFSNIKDNTRHYFRNLRRNVYSAISSPFKKMSARHEARKKENAEAKSKQRRELRQEDRGKEFAARKNESDYKLSVIRKLKELEIPYNEKFAESCFIGVDKAFLDKLKKNKGDVDASA